MIRFADAIVDIVQIVWALQNISKGKLIGLAKPQASADIPEAQNHDTLKLTEFQRVKRTNILEMNKQ
jgi:hypothetical protein